MAAFQGMHVSNVKHSYVWLPRKCDYWTDRQTHGQTPDKVIPMYRCASQATQTGTQQLLKWSYLYLDKNWRGSYIVNAGYSHKDSLYVWNSLKSKSHFMLRLFHWTSLGTFSILLSLMLYVRVGNISVIYVMAQQTGTRRTLPIYVQAVEGLTHCLIPWPW